jgi:adenylate cyclase
MVASSGFANAERMSRFLRYVVERSLAGESEQIKEYAIGVDVFGRSADYDPRLDSIVRVEARRLRSKLDEYYASEGKDEDVVISIRRGTYVPVFECRQAEPVTPPPAAKTDAPLPFPPARGRTWRVGVAMALVIVAIVSVAAWRQGLLVSTRETPSISVAVLPFTHYSTNTEDALIAARMTEDVTSELARLGVARVIAHTSVRQFAGTSTPAPQIAESLNARTTSCGSTTSPAR